MSLPLVSVVMPVYNGEAFLAEAIDSVLSQSHSPTELVAVDDGSTDGSATILSRYGDRITVVRQQNAGVAAARNAGISRARGDFIAFLDQDDWWLPQKIERQLDILRADHRIGLVHTAIKSYDADCDCWVAPLNPLARPETMVETCYEQLLLGNPIANSSVIVARRALDDVGILDMRIQGNTVQDYDLWLRIARRHRFGHVPERLTVVRLHSRQGRHNLCSMLREELKVLLRQRSEHEWRLSALTRERLADLYDRLATAHFEAGNAWQARRHFANALRTSKLPRRLARFSISCLPYLLVKEVRRHWQEKQSSRLKQTTPPRHPVCGPDNYIVDVADRLQPSKDQGVVT